MRRRSEEERPSHSVGDSGWKASLLFPVSVREYQTSQALEAQPSVLVLWELTRNNVPSMAEELSQRSGESPAVAAPTVPLTEQLTHIPREVANLMEEPFAIREGLFKPRRVGALSKVVPVQGVPGGNVQVLGGDTRRASVTRKNSGGSEKTNLRVLLGAPDRKVRGCWVTPGDALIAMKRYDELKRHVDGAADLVGLVVELLVQNIVRLAVGFLDLGPRLTGRRLDGDRGRRG